MSQKRFSTSDFTYFMSFGSVWAGPFDRCNQHLRKYNQRHSCTVSGFTIKKFEKNVVRASSYINRHWTGQKGLLISLIFKAFITKVLRVSMWSSILLTQKYSEEFNKVQVLLKIMILVTFKDDYTSKTLFSVTSLTGNTPVWARFTKSRNRKIVR